MGDDNEKNILYGGPDPPLIDPEARSLGEVILKKLAVNENDVIFVSKFISASIFKTDTQIFFGNEKHSTKYRNQISFGTNADSINADSAFLFMDFYFSFAFCCYTCVFSFVRVHGIYKD